MGDSDPYEVLTWTPASSPKGNLLCLHTQIHIHTYIHTHTTTFSLLPPGSYLVMNHAQIVVTGGVVTASVDIILQNSSSLLVSPSATLAYPQTSPGQFTLYTIDTSSVTFDHASLQTGGYILAPTMCGASRASLTELNLANSKEALTGYIAPFLRERASLSLVGGKGSKHPLEISLNDQSSASVTNASNSKIAVSAIITIDDLVTSGVIDGLDPSKSVTKTYRFTTKSTGVDLTFTIVNSQVLSLTYTHTHSPISLFLPLSL